MEPHYLIPALGVLLAGLMFKGYSCDRDWMGLEIVLRAAGAAIVFLVALVIWTSLLALGVIK